MRLRYLAAAVTVSAAVATALAQAASATPAQAAPATRAAAHVVVAGISGLEWSDITPGSNLYRIAEQGSVGALVDYAVLPLTCPADGWLTLNAGARADLRHREAGPCPALPAVADGTVSGMAGIVADNASQGYSPAWGALRTGLSCTVAVGPGAGLALADTAGRVGDYLPSAAGLTEPDLARCPLTVVDLGVLPPGAPADGSHGSAAARANAVRSADAALGHLAAELPPDTTLLIASPGSLVKSRLGVAVISGNGYAAGLLRAVSTRQPGLVVITDLTSTVRAMLGEAPGGTVITSGNRGSLPAAIGDFTATATAERGWMSTHILFFGTYALADALALGAIALGLWGAAPERRRRRAGLWRVAAVFAAAMPAGTFLANLVPWSRQSHPAAWLYGASLAIGLLLGGAALAAGWQRRLREDPLAPFGMICLFTVIVLGIDVMAGSRLQLQTPFGLSLLEAGRFYGIGNEALGIYGIAALGGAGWLALRLSGGADKRRALIAVAAVGVFAIFASGWPGFGGKAGGTITLVPCFLVLAYAVAGWRFTWRRVLLIAVSGLALLAVFALINYLVPATGNSDIGAFAGNVAHGRKAGGDLLLRKIHSNIGSLKVNAFSPVIPAVLIVTGLMLWRPAWFRLKLPSRAFTAMPFLAVLLGDMWLLAVLGWFANDSGIIVPAAAMPFALPLGIGLLAAATLTIDHGILVRLVPPPPLVRTPPPSAD